jgi:hypothetical protein
MIECKPLSSKRQTAFGGLCALGDLLAREGALEPLSGVEVAQKTVEHSPNRSSPTPSWASSLAVRPSTRPTSGCARTRPCRGPSAGSAVPTNPPSRGPWTP